MLLIILKLLVTLPSMFTKFFSFLQSQSDIHAGEAMQANVDHAEVDKRVQQGQVIEEDTTKMTIDQLNQELGR